MLIITNMHMNNIKYQMNCTPKLNSIFGVQFFYVKIF